MSIGGVNAQQTDWTQTASIDHLQFTRPGMDLDADFIISAGGKIDALVDDLDAFALPVTLKDLLWAMGDFESHFNRSTPGSCPNDLPERLPAARLHNYELTDVKLIPATDLRARCGCCGM
jgi:hypothetical protein